MKPSKKTLISIIANAAESAFNKLRKTYPGHQFYYYVLWTTGVVHRPAPCACSEEGLQEIFEKYKKEGHGIDIRDLRWSEADSPFDLFGDDYFKPVEESFSLFGAPYQLSEETREMLLSCIIQALANLDSKGFFGTGAERNKVVLNVTMPGDETEKDLLARARLLNPKDALITYESDWSN